MDGNARNLLPSRPLVDMGGGDGTGIRTGRSDQFGGAHPGSDISVLPHVRTLGVLHLGHAAPCHKYYQAVLKRSVAAVMKPISILILLLQNRESEVAF